MKANTLIELRKLFVGPDAETAEPGQIGSCAMQRGEGVNDRNREMPFVVQTTDEARDGMIIAARAFENTMHVFQRNPVFKAAHLSSGPAGEPTVIGSWPTLRSGEKGLSGRARFSTTQLAEDYWLLYSDGSMRMVSIEWLTLSAEPHITTEGRRVPKITEAELLSIDAVAVGSDRGALAKRALALCDVLPSHRSAPAVTTYKRLEELLGPSIERIATQRHAVTEQVQRQSPDVLAALFKPPQRGAGLGDAIRAKREQLERSLESVASNLPITAAGLRTLERGDGNAPDDTTLRGLAGELDLDYDDLKSRASADAASESGDVMTDAVERLVRTTVDKTIKRVFTADGDGTLRFLLNDVVEDALRRANQGDEYVDDDDIEGTGGEKGTRTESQLDRIAAMARG